MGSKFQWAPEEVAEVLKWMKENPSTCLADIPPVVTERSRAAVRAKAYELATKLQTMTADEILNKLKYPRESSRKVKKVSSQNSTGSTAQELKNIAAKLLQLADEVQEDEAWIEQTIQLRKRKGLKVKVDGNGVVHSAEEVDK